MSSRRSRGHAGVPSHPPRARAPTGGGGGGEDSSCDDDSPSASRSIGSSRFAASERRPTQHDYTSALGITPGGSSHGSVESSTAPSHGGPSGFVARPGPSQSTASGASGRRPPGALPISDLLSHGTPQPARPTTLTGEPSDPQQTLPIGALPPSGPTSTSPTDVRSQPSSGRRPFFDPARDSQEKDVSMTGTTPVTSPLQRSFPASSSYSFGPAPPESGFASSYLTDPFPDSPIEYVRCCLASEP